MYDKQSVNILGVRVSAVNIEMAVGELCTWISSRTPNYVCVANVHTVTESQRDQRLRQINNRAGMVTPDGMPLVWVSRLQGYRNVSRVYGPALLLAACERSLKTGWSHYFYGGAPGVAEKLAANLLKRFPGLKVAGLESPPFRSLSPEEDQNVIERVNAARPDILWIGLGAPKQEYWMAEHIGRINAPVMIGIGAAFDFHAGVKKQAPRWMQRCGLEWLYRLASEPRRLWRRYLYNNPLFLWLVLLQLLKIRKFELDN